MTRRSCASIGEDSSVRLSLAHGVPLVDAPLLDSLGVSLALVKWSGTLFVRPPSALTHADVCEVRGESAPPQWFCARRCRALPERVRGVWTSGRLVATLLSVDDNHVAPDGRTRLHRADDLRECRERGRRTRDRTDRPGIDHPQKVSVHSHAVSM